MAGVRDLDGGWLRGIWAGDAVTHREVDEFGQGRHQWQEMVVLDVHAVAGDEDSIAGGQHAVEKRPTGVDPRVAVAGERLP